jgi:hypothetical protein
MALAVVILGVGMVVVVFVSREVIVAAPNCVIVTGFPSGILSNESEEAPSHLTQKCLRRVDHEVMTDGEFCLKFLYHSSASKPDRQFR